MLLHVLYAPPEDALGVGTLSCATGQTTRYTGAGPLKRAVGPLRTLQTKAVRRGSRVGAAHKGATGLTESILRDMANDLAESAAVVDRPWPAIRSSKGTCETVPAQV